MKLNKEILVALNEAKNNSPKTLENLCEKILMEDYYDASEYFLKKINTNTIEKLDIFLKREYNSSILEYAKFVEKKYGNDNKSLEILVLPLVQIILDERTEGKLGQLFKKYSDILSKLPKKFKSTMIVSLLQLVNT